MISQLPTFDNFPSSAPRYPNLWLFVSKELAKNYKEALEFVIKRLEESIDMIDDYGYFHTAEGCDAVGRRRGLQYMELGENGEWSHDHSLHLRFYTHYVKQQPLMNMEGKEYFPISISVHYEVDRPSHLHPYVDECPICGCTDEYAHYYQEEYRNRSSKQKNEYTHDPMGVEAILWGTVKGKKIPLIDGLDVHENHFDMHLEIFPKSALREDMETGNIGVVLFKGEKL